MSLLSRAGDNMTRSLTPFMLPALLHGAKRLAACLRPTNHCYSSSYTGESDSPLGRTGVADQGAGLLPLFEPQLKATCLCARLPHRGKN